MTDAKPRRMSKSATAATSAASTADAEATLVEPVPAVDASAARATKPRARARTAVPSAAGPADAQDAPTQPAVRRTSQATAVTAPGPAAAEPPVSASGRRPGLPLREPGQARKRPVKKVTDAVGDGSIDPGEPDPFALAMARRIVEVAEDKKASDIVLLDVRALTAVTDYFIICSGMSERQLGAIADGIAETLKAESKVLPIGREGGANAHWVLLDFGAAIVHVMATPEREYYQLEKLWADAKVLLHVL